MDGSAGCAVVVFVAGQTAVGNLVSANRGISAWAAVTARVGKSKGAAEAVRVSASRVSAASSGHLSATAVVEPAWPYLLFAVDSPAGGVGGETAQNPGVGLRPCLAIKAGRVYVAARVPAIFSPAVAAKAVSGAAVLVRVSVGIRGTVRRARPQVLFCGRDGGAEVDERAGAAVAGRAAAGLKVDDSPVGTAAEVEARFGRIAARRPPYVVGQTAADKEARRPTAFSVEGAVS